MLVSSQLHAILPAEHQRLVKYPLLLEQLAKQTKQHSSSSANASNANEDSTEDGDQGVESSSSELSTVRRCVDRTRSILESIDRRVAEAQNAQRLEEIQRNLDTSGLEKMPDSNVCQEYRVSHFYGFFSLQRPFGLYTGLFGRYKGLEFGIVWENGGHRSCLFRFLPFSLRNW